MVSLAEAEFAERRIVPGVVRDKQQAVRARLRLDEWHLKRTSTASSAVEDHSHERQSVETGGQVSEPAAARVLGAAALDRLNCCIEHL